MTAEQDSGIPELRTFGVIEVALGGVCMVTFPARDPLDWVEVGVPILEAAGVLPEQGQMFAADVPFPAASSDHLQPDNIGPYKAA